MTRVLNKLGCKRGFIVHGSDGMDEITLTGPTHVGEISRKSLDFYDVRPEDYGLKPCTLEDLKGGDAERNAEIVKAILSGKNGPCREVVLLNSAFALLATDKVPVIADGLKLAAEVIDQGIALKKLNGLVEITNQ
jgi:anthranilate phosphoribosyltransferase